MKTRHAQSVGVKVPIGVAAQELGVSVDTVRRWEADGLIKSSRTAGGQRRFEWSEIERVKAGEPLPAPDEAATS